MLFAAHVAGQADDQMLWPPVANAVVNAKAAGGIAAAGGEERPRPAGEKIADGDAGFFAPDIKGQNNHQARPVSADKLLMSNPMRRAASDRRRGGGRSKIMSALAGMAIHAFSPISDSNCSESQLA